jgi:hypothetical protein
LARICRDSNSKNLMRRRGTLSTGSRCAHALFP